MDTWGELAFAIFGIALTLGLIFGAAKLMAWVLSKGEKRK